MKRSSSGDKIATRPRMKTLQTTQRDTVVGMGQVYLDCQVERSAEVDALARLREVPRLSKLHQQIALLERIGLNPDFLPHYPVRERPSRPLYGKALWAWIGRQPGITMRASEVETWLRQVESILNEQAEAGIEG